MRERDSKSLVVVGEHFVLFLLVGYLCVLQSPTLSDPTVSPLVSHAEMSDPGTSPLVPPKLRRQTLARLLSFPPKLRRQTQPRLLSFPLPSFLFPFQFPKAHLMDLQTFSRFVYGAVLFWYSSISWCCQLPAEIADLLPKTPQRCGQSGRHYLVMLEIMLF